MKLNLAIALSLGVIAAVGLAGAGRGTRGRAGDVGGAFAAAQPGKAGEAGKKAEPSEFEKKLEALDERGGKVRTLRGSFVQKKHTLLLKKPLESRGTVVIKGERTKWETTEPQRSVMTIDGKGLRIYYPDQKLVEVYKLGEDVREFSGSPLPRLAGLRASFDVTELKASEAGGTDDDKSVLAFELRPKGEELRKHLARVRVLVDTEIPATRRLEIEDVDGERTEISFKDVKVNAGVEDADLELGAPAGTREVYPLGEPPREPAEEKPKPVKEPGK